MRKKTAAASYRFAALGWVNEDGYWRRYVVRVSDEDGAIMCDEVHWVDADFLCCLSCLSQHVAPMDGVEGRVQCLECEMISEVPDGPPWFH
jgi:hypothetical protein